MPVKIFTQNQLKLLPTFFEKRSYFSRAADGFQLDAVTHRDKAFMLKVKPGKISLLDTEYNNDVNIGMGTGTGKSSRFGDRLERRYTEQEVNYKWFPALDLGVDPATVNYPLADAIADAQVDLADAQVEFMDTKIAEELVARAGESVPLGAAINSTNIEAAFTSARQTLSNNKIKKETRHAYVTPDVLDFLAANAMLTDAKGQVINLMSAEVIGRYKGFDLIEVPEDLMPSGIKAILTVDNVTNPYEGLEVVRYLSEVEGHLGGAIQYAARNGIYTLEENEKAIVTIAG